MQKKTQSKHWYNQVLEKKSPKIGHYTINIALLFFLFYNYIANRVVIIEYRSSRVRVVKKIANRQMDSIEQRWERSIKKIRQNIKTIGRKAKDLVSLFSSIDIALRNRVIE